MTNFTFEVEIFQSYSSSLYICIFHLQTSTFFLHIFKVQFSDKRIHTGGRQPSALCLAVISLLLTEQVPFAVKDLSV